MNSTYVCIYMIVWFAVVSGINSLINLSRKVVGAAKHYHTVHTCIVSTINPNTTTKHTVIN